MNEYWNEYGLLQDSLPLTKIENASLYTVEYAILDPYISNDQIFKALLRLKDTNGKWHCYPDYSYGPEQGFSRDNAIGTFTFLGSQYPNEFKQIWKDSKLDFRWLNPQDIIWFWYMAGKWYGKLLLPITHLCILWACWSMSKCENGALDTDGKLLSFVRLAYTQDKPFSRFMYKLVTKILVKRLNTETPWTYLFGQYFQDPNHPINKRIQLLGI